MFRSVQYYLKLFILLAVTGIAGQSCMKPLDSDFGNSSPGLKDNEMVWILRVPASTDSLSESSIPRNDLARLKALNTPIFESALPQVIRDVLNGNIPAYEDFTRNKESRISENVEKKLKQLGGTKQNYRPLNQTFEIFSVVNTRANAYQSHHEFIGLVWSDPEKIQSERSFVAVDINDIIGNEYKVFFKGDSIPFEKYLETEKFYFLPVYLLTNQREYRLQSLDESLYLRDKVVNGKWNEIDWVENGLNISGKKQVEMEPEKLLNYSGLYEMVSGRKDSISKKAELFLTAENDYLIADWSNRFRIEKVIPYSDSAFFSHSGDIYQFSMSKDSILNLLFIQGKDSLNGMRMVNRL